MNGRLLRTNENRHADASTKFTGAVALNTVGAVSIKHTHEILSGVFNIPIATGTISSMVKSQDQSIRMLPNGGRCQRLSKNHVLRWYGT